MTINTIADDAIGLFIESLDGAGLDITGEELNIARAKALSEISEGCPEVQAQLDLYPELVATLRSVADAYAAHGNLLDVMTERMPAILTALRKAHEVERMSPVRQEPAEATAIVADPDVPY